eukprot:3429470-Rhodomonas_salina.1
MWPIISCFSRFGRLRIRAVRRGYATAVQSEERIRTSECRVCGKLQAGPCCRPGPAKASVSEQQIAERTPR